VAAGEIVALAVVGLTASATMAGVETDIADASRRLPHALLVVPPLALFVLHVLLIIVFTAIAGSSGSEPVLSPRWAWLVPAGLVLICLAACVTAFSRSVPIAKVGVVYLTGSAIGSIMAPRRPRRGGSGADRRAHRRGRAGRGRGQRGAGVPAADILAFRPVRLGAPRYLERERAL
jgi:hypothetical protein